MCKNKECRICHSYVVISDVEKCTFGPFVSEQDAIDWAKHYHYSWPEGSWRVQNLYPISIG